QSGDQVDRLADLGVRVGLVVEVAQGRPLGEGQVPVAALVPGGQDRQRLGHVFVDLRAVIHAPGAYWRRGAGRPRPDPMPPQAWKSWASSRKRWTSEARKRR